MNKEKVFTKIVEKTKNYVLSNNIRSMVLGVSGGIDSTVVAAICKEVSELTGVPLIGRSLTIANGREEFTLAKKVGNAFCSDFKELYLWDLYSEISNFMSFNEVFESSKISKGNIMARLRMIYLYNLAGITGGIVMDTGNLTEHYLGFWTIHGDEGDFGPIGGLWKTEVYEIAEYLCSKYEAEGTDEDGLRIEAMREAIKITPTDGNGVTPGGDLEQIGGKSYSEVDDILRYITMDEIKPLRPENMDEEVYEKIKSRYNSSMFKRKTSRTINIERKEFVNELVQ